MDSTRRAAYLVLRDVEEKKAYSNIAVTNILKKRKDARAPFLRELVYGVLRNKLFLDYLIGNFVKTPIEKLHISDRILLRLGLYQLSLLDGVPSYAAVSETVDLAKHYARGRESFINAVLRQYLRDKEYVTLPPREEDEVKYLSIKYSFAPWIIEMWLNEFDNIEYMEHLLAALNARPRFCIRVNTLKTEPEWLKTRLENIGFTVEADEDLPDVFFIDGDRPLSTDLYKNGYFSVQDKASRIAAESVGAQPGDTVIDLCAAPGGKTMAIAEQMKNMGKISATDIHKRKIELIEAEAERLGVKIVTAWSWDARVIDSELVDTADRVLVDAPCSGLGTARRKPEVKYKEFDEAMQSLPQKQLDILKAASHYVKPGGILVYSTCTIGKRENQEVVSAFLKSNKSFTVLDTIQLLPITEEADGFFICKMKRADGFFEG